MRTVSVAHAKAHFSELLNTVEAGGMVLITKHGRAIARMSAPEIAKQPLPLKRLSLLRKNTLPWGEPSVKLVRSLRDDE